MESLLSIFGSIVSIGSAIWACIEARKSATSATKAEVVRNEMIDRRELAEVSKIYAQTSKILSVISKIGPSCSPSKLKGVDCPEIAKEVEEYSRYLNEQSSNFNQEFSDKVTFLCNDLNADIEELSEAIDPERIKEAGKKIYYKINNFMPIIKGISLGKQEKTITI